MADSTGTPAKTESSGKGSSFGKTLTSKVGGVPVWAIGVGFALVILAALWYRNKVRNAADSTSEDVTSPDGSTPTDVSSVNGNPIDDLLSSDPTNSAYPVGLTAQGTPAPITNAQWSRLALDELIAKGDDPTLVSNALSKYLEGETLSAAEQGIVNLALQVFGAPPEGIIPITTTGTEPPVTNPVGGGTQPPQGPTHLPPITLKVAGTTRTTVNLDWNAVAGAMVYEIYRTTPDPAHSTHIGGAVSTHFTVQNVKPGTSATYWVRAFNSKGQTSDSNHVTATTKA